MREIYFDRKEFEQKYRPDKNPINGLCPLNHPELFITSKIHSRSYPEGFQSDVPELVSFSCNLLLTNPSHDGIWLIKNDEKNEIDIPNGYITEEDWRYVNKNPYYVIISSLIRTLGTINPIYRNTYMTDPMVSFIDNPTLASLRDLLFYVLGQNRFEPTNPSAPMLFYYQYWLPNAHLYEMKHLHSHCKRLQDFTIYIILEVKEPVDKISPFTNYSKDCYLWYSRADHKYNRMTEDNKRSAFKSTYKTDIRLTESGLDVLENIFRTETIFGKINIY